MEKRAENSSMFFLKVIKCSLILLLISSCAIGQNKTNDCKVELINGDSVYRNVDILPVPKYGYNSLFDIVKSNVVIDDESIKKLGISDISIVFEFIVSSSGKVISCSIVEKNELIHVKDIIVNEMSKIAWIPGECHQIKVNTAIKVPVKFRV